MAERTFVIVGAGFAGAKAAETLRTEGFDDRVILLGAEHERPYERPPLSKDYLRGESGRDKVYVHDESFYVQNDIELRTDTWVEEVDLDASDLVLTGNERLAYDRLLLTVGAEPRRLQLPGADLDGIYYLRSVEDSDTLRQRFAGSRELVVVGAGWIGAEVAASARDLGLEVTMVEPTSVPLERVLGPEVGAIYGDIHREHGVELVCGTGVDGFEGNHSVSAVRTSDGRRIGCDLVVVGVGVLPRTSLANKAGIDVDNGVLVDEQLETSVPGVFAAGDVANHAHPFYQHRIRVEHWANALNQGPAAARNMLGRGEAYSRLPYFFSDQYDVGMEYSGFAGGEDEVVLRGDPSAREFIAFWLKDSRVVAGMNVNIWDVTEQIQGLVRSQAVVDAQVLSDVGVSLDDVTAESARRR